MYLKENVVTESDHIHNYTIEVRQRSFPFEIFKLCKFNVNIYMSFQAKIKTMNKRNQILSKYFVFENETRE